MVRILTDNAFEGQYRYIEAAGLSTDSKPSGKLITGSTFTEVDTGDLFLYDEVSKQWNKVGGTAEQAES